MVAYFHYQLVIVALVADILLVVDFVVVHHLMVGIVETFYSMYFHTKMILIRFNNIHNDTKRKLHKINGKFRFYFSSSIYNTMEMVKNYFRKIK